MGKLLSHQLKRFFSQNWAFLAAPIILALVNFGSAVLKLEITPLIFGFSYACLFGLYVGSMITLIVNDYDLFYGKNALFYQSIPISPGAKTLARLFKYLIIFIVFTLVYGTIFFLFTSLVISMAEFNTADLSPLLKLIHQGLESFGYGNILVLILIFLAWLIYFIAKIMASISIGSEKKLAKFNFGGPVLVFAVLSLIESLVLSLIDKLGVLSHFGLEMTETGLLVDSGTYLFIGLTILEGLALLAVTYIEHRDRVSVS